MTQCVKWDVHGLGGDPTKRLIDMHSIHCYTADKDHLPNAVAPRSAERAIEMAMALVDLARIENGVPPTVPRQTICFDEWNVWDPLRAPGERGAEEKYTLSDALAVGVWLNIFVRQSSSVGMANIAQSVNVISPLMTTKRGVVKQTTWWPLVLFSKYMRGHTIALNVRAPEYTGKTTPAWIRGIIETPYLDCSATISEDEYITLAVVNIHETQDFEVEIRGVTNMVTAYIISGDSIDAVNTEGEEKVGVKEGSWDGVGKYRFGKASVTLLRWKN